MFVTPNYVQDRLASLAPDELDIPGYSYSSSSESDEASPIYTTGYYPSAALQSTVPDLSSYPRHFNDTQRQDFPLTDQDTTRINPVGCYNHQIITPPLTTTTPTIPFSAGLPLHAPIPLPGYPSLLSCSDSQIYGYPTPPSESPQPRPYYGLDADPNFVCQPQENPLAFYPNVPAQHTFPTPSELLSELAAKDTTAAQTSIEPILEKKSETTRKARQRAVAKSIGFEPTDPDSISSHEKKRHYLECLEHYVMYLHEQLSLVGAEPVSLERVSNYRGLSSRSIRTLLVHMENMTRKLNYKTLAEEQMFVMLRENVLKQDAAAVAAVQEYQRISMASSTTSVGSASTPGSYTSQHG